MNCSFTMQLTNFTIIIDLDEATLLTFQQTPIKATFTQSFLLDILATKCSIQAAMANKPRFR